MERAVRDLRQSSHDVQARGDADWILPRRSRALGSGKEWFAALRLGTCFAACSRLITSFRLPCGARFRASSQASRRSACDRCKRGCLRNAFTNSKS